MSIKPQAVIFDMDGVIFDTERIYFESCVEAAEKYKLESIERVCLDCVGTSSMREVFLEAYGKDFPFDAYSEEAGRISSGKLQNGYPMKEGAAELLDALMEHNIPAAVASSTATKAVVKALMKAGIIHCFRKIVGGDMVKNGKPDPEIFLTAAALLDVPPEGCLVIEDSPHGISAAHKAGMIPVFVPDLIQPDDKTRETAAAVLPSLKAVKDLLEL